jgi:hypothetical protein
MERLYFAIRSDIPSLIESRQPWRRKTLAGAGASTAILQSRTPNHALPI